MKRKFHFTAERGSTLVVAICVLTVISIIAAGVLANANARYNVGSKAIKAWKEALYAAEAGGDLAFNEIRKPYFSTPGASFASGWVLNDASAPPPNPGSALAPDYSIGYGNTAPTFGTNNNLSAKVTVDKLGNLPGNSTTYYYRIRSLGVAQMFGLKRTGMNDALQESSGTHFGSGTAARGNGDSLLRKIDYNYDHYKATYGYGDVLPSAVATSSNGKASVAVSDPNHGQVMRRIEMVAVPMMPIEGAVKTVGGAYNFPTVDSYNSANGAYPGTTCATTPTCTTYADARDGDVIDGSSTFHGTVYGDVTTNGGNADKNHVTGVIDNNVPVAPVANWAEPPAALFPAATTAPSTLTPSAEEIAPTGNTPVDSRQQRTFYYHYSSLGSITINPAPAMDPTGLGGGVVETYIHIKVDGDVTSNTITVGKGVFAKIYFHGNVSAKANTFDNNNAEPLSGVMLPRTGTMTLSSASTTMTSTDVTFTASDVGKQVRGIGIPSGTTIAAFVNSSTVTLSATPSYNGTQSAVTLGGYTSSTNTSEADHFWMIGEGTNQSIVLGSGSPQTTYVVWYAPNADFTVNGNPDFVGAFVVKSMTGNGNNTLHFDKALLNAGTPLDYRIASYVEDIR
ncbi:MAG: type II secretion system protein [Chthoniobacterales bacterium]